MESPDSFENLPNSFKDEEALEEFMTRPSDALIRDLEKLPGDIMVLGVGGKMGPTLARLAKRAAPAKNVIGVARFSDPNVRHKLEDWGVETLTCDLLDRESVAKLPQIKNIVYMAGRKFGTAGAAGLTWAMNAYVPAIVGENFSKSRIVALSSGCVYPYVNVLHQGATEDQPAEPPPGDYAMSCVGREQIFQYFSGVSNTPGRLIRLNYAIDMRYGVLHDVAKKVLNEEPIDLKMGHVNVIWQGDANAQILRSLLHCTTPTSPLNISGPEIISIRALATEFGKQLDKDVQFRGEEAETAWITNTSQAVRLFGYPLISLPQMVSWVREWVSEGKSTLGKATHYEVRNGSY
ncbi:MAG: NAD-dependent epimerase/dehydratase family protein [SAR324 cluster bacterium]|nr:NAD-dependent epimerase/dehydratase family protein [SAR324 cluster bacterium]